MFELNGWVLGCEGGGRGWGLGEGKGRREREANYAMFCIVGCDFRI